MVSNREPTVSTVFYYTTDMAQAVLLWVDVVGYPRPSASETADWVELDGNPVVFLNRVESLDSCDSNIAVQVSAFSQVLAAAQSQEPTLKIGGVFEIEPGHSAVSLKPLHGQALLIHE